MGLWRDLDFSWILMYQTCRLDIVYALVLICLYMCFVSVNACLFSSLFILYLACFVALSISYYVISTLCCHQSPKRGRLKCI